MASNRKNWYRSTDEMPKTTLAKYKRLLNKEHKEVMAKRKQLRLLREYFAKKKQDTVAKLEKELSDAISKLNADDGEESTEGYAEELEAFSQTNASQNDANEAGDEDIGFSDVMPDEISFAVPNEVEDSDADFENSDDDFICPGSSMTAKEFNLALMGYSLITKLTKVDVINLLNLLEVAFPSGSKLPSSPYMLEKIVNLENSSVKKCFYCTNCERPVVTQAEECEHCQERINEAELVKEGKYFLQFDLKEALENKLKIPEVNSNLYENLLRRNESHRQCRTTPSEQHCYRDIVDGKAYRDLNLDSNDITCSINTDGVNVFKSSKFSMWPMFVSINELSYKLRRKHTVLAGLWFGYKKPSFDTYLTPFVTQCNVLSDDGLSWAHNNFTLNSKVYFPIIAADSAARPPLQGIKQHNGYYSCPYCLIRGKYLKEEKKMSFPPEKAAKRTNEGFLDDLSELAKRRKSGGTHKAYHGIVNLSPFQLLRKFKAVQGFVVDYMHTGLLGVLKSYTNMLIDSSNSKEDYYLNPVKQAELNSRLSRTKIPSEVNRVVRDLNDIAYWKANEWKTWCLISVPLLNNLLPNQYLSHYSKLVLGMVLLTSDSVTESDIQLAEKMFNELNRDAAALYGERVLTFNMHLLTHAGECVRNWGPLHCYSLFQYENANGHLGSLFNGTRCVCMQIIKKVQQLQELRNKSNEISKGRAAKGLLDSYLEQKLFYKKVHRCRSGVTFLGPRKLYTLNETEHKILAAGSIALNSQHQVWRYKQLLWNGKRYCATDSQKINNGVALIDKSAYVLEKLLLATNDASESRTSQGIVFGRKLTVAATTEKNNCTLKVTRISPVVNAFPCESLTNVKFITLYDSDGELSHICKLPNNVEME